MEDIYPSNYVRSLRLRHAQLLLGYHGKVADSHLLGWIVNEAALLSLNGLDVRKINNFWFIGSSIDWIKYFSKTDENYFLFFSAWPEYTENMQASGAILTAFSESVGASLNGKITWSNVTNENDLIFLRTQLNRLESRRVVFFKSTENIMIDFPWEGRESPDVY